jgi:hypothetical protein
MQTNPLNNKKVHLRPVLHPGIVCKSLLLNDLYTQHGWSPIKTPRQTLITSFSTITYNRINPEIRPIAPPTFSPGIPVGIIEYECCCPLHISPSFATGLLSGRESFLDRTDRYLAIQLNGERMNFY